MSGSIEVQGADGSRWDIFGGAANWSLDSLPAQRAPWYTLTDDPFGGPMALGWANPWLQVHPENNRWRDDLTFTFRRWLPGERARLVEFDPGTLGFRVVAEQVPQAYLSPYRWGETVRDSMLRRTQYWSDGRASIPGFDRWQPCGPDTPVIAIAIGTHKFRVVPFGNLRREAWRLNHQAAIDSGPWLRRLDGYVGLWARDGRPISSRLGGRPAEVLDPVLVEKWRTR